MASWDCTVCVCVERGVDTDLNADLREQCVDCKVGQGMGELTELKRVRWRPPGWERAVKPMPIQH